jgi:hypothetical protein
MEGLLLRKEELSVVPPRDQVIAAPIEQGPWRPRHQGKVLGVTIRDASDFLEPTTLP